VVIKLIGLHGE